MIHRLSPRRLRCLGPGAEHPGTRFTITYRETATFPKLRARPITASSRWIHAGDGVPANMNPSALGSPRLGGCLGSEATHQPAAGGSCLLLCRHAIAPMP